MDIKNLNIKNKAVLAPMAGFCDIVMRKVADSYTAGFTVSEMVCARALYYGDKKSRQLMESKEHTSPYGIQLFGFDERDFEKATQLCLEYNPDFIDINMGCPAPKIVTNGSGSALMKTPELAQRLVKATVANAGGIPVSVKIRKGWDEGCVTAVEIAKRCEYEGASFITVHGRTRKEMYTPGIDFDIIRAVKAAVSIPVIGNGDITSPKNAVDMLAYTGCDYIMVGRQALSTPWIFREIDDAVNNRPISPPPTLEERMELLLWHFKELCSINGEELGMKKARGQGALYMKGLKNAAQLRHLTNSLTVYGDAENLVNEVLKANV